MRKDTEPLPIEQTLAGDGTLHQTLVLAMQVPAAQALAIDLLANEQVVAAPTDTVYGVMCRFDSAAGIQRLYIAKDRPPQKAIPILLAGIDQLAHLVEGELSTQARCLVEHFWPGPLTLVLPAQPTLLETLTAGQATIAVRMPAHAALQALLRATGPVAATSANRSGWPDATSAAEVLAQLGGRIPLILADDDEADQHKSRVPSTIVDLTVTPARILRPGLLATDVEKVLVARC